MHASTDYATARAVVPGLVVLASSPSTNAELVARARAAELPSFTVLVTTDQTAGRGRLGRSWTAPAGSALAISVLIAPRGPGGHPIALDRFGWFSIAAGVAMAETVAAVLPGRQVAFKWPNDVLIGGHGEARKVCGVLAELVAERHAVVVGAGVNLTMTAEQLPVPTATSLALEGAESAAITPDAVLAAYLSTLRAHTEAYERAGADADASGLRARARELCSTLGSRVRVDMPDGAALSGEAVDLEPDGRLRLRVAGGGDLVVAAGDVTHLRHA
jgi:BirA family transcriptional regulator, biotin operon repressor / biotin---[acetyl-CoA-carboxylase] ligase